MRNNESKGVLRVVTAFIYDPPLAEVQVLYRDDDLLLVDKPAGLLSVPGRGVAHADCLLTRIMVIVPAALLVHRLDMDTSGCMVFALNKVAQRSLGRQFERKEIVKEYEAVVDGQPDADSGLVELPLIVDWPNRPLQKVCFDTGKPSMTAWQVLQRHDNCTRLRLSPKTGRSHQLRVHMQAIGHPILGDRFYAKGRALAGAGRLMLHATQLTVRHPVNGKILSFSSPCPF